MNPASMSQYSSYADGDDDVIMRDWDEADVVAGTAGFLDHEMDVDRDWRHADAHEDTPLELDVEMDLDTHYTATQGDMQVSDLVANMASLEIVDDMDLDPDSDESAQEQSNVWLSAGPGHTQSTWELEGHVTMIDADDMELDA